MPDQPTIIINRSNIAWVLVIIAALWIIFSQWKSCGKDAETQQQYAQLQQRNDSVEADRARTQQEKTRDSLQFVSNIKWITQDRNENQQGKDSVIKVLNTLQKNNKGLPGRILEYVNITDTAFQHKCDSAARALLAASKSYDDLKLEDSLTKALYEYEIKIRNLYAADVQRFLDSCNSQQVRTSAILNKALDIYKPRPSLWFGGEATNSPYYTSFGAVIAFQSKNGRMEYSLSSGPILKGGTYVNARVISKIKLHK